MGLNWVQHFLAPSGFPFRSRNASKRQPVGIFAPYTQLFFWHMLCFQTDLGMTSDTGPVALGSSSYLPVNSPLIAVPACVWGSSIIRLGDLFVSLSSKNFFHPDRTRSGGAEGASGWWNGSPPPFFFLLEIGKWMRGFPFYIATSLFSSLLWGRQSKLQAPSLGIQSRPSPFSTASLLSPSQGGSPTLTPGRDWWNHWVETDCDSTRWAGFDRVDSEQLLSGGRGGEGKGGGGNPRARADP